MTDSQLSNDVIGDALDALAAVETWMGTHATALAAHAPGGFHRIRRRVRSALDAAGRPLDQAAAAAKLANESGPRRFRVDILKVKPTDQSGTWETLGHYNTRVMARKAARNWGGYRGPSNVKKTRVVDTQEQEGGGQ